MLRSLLLPLILLGALVARLPATWSMILIDTRTGEIAVASATCLTGFDLAVWVPVVVVGKGAGCAQSFVDPSGVNRQRIFNELRNGTDPARILELLEQGDPQHQTRQYGIVDLQGRAIGFTGTGAGPYADHRTGRIGDIVYAVQGNVLTGAAVLAAAELAIVTTQGDLATKMMAAMEEARRFGGDGRCSCDENDPIRCGAPPPSFRKSADVAFMIVARPGDRDGSCNPAAGCASGSYYMRLNVANQSRAAPDPVIQLRSLFDQWKQNEIGRPDHVLSTAILETPDLPFDGASTVNLRITLRDREGNQLPTGGATISIAQDPNAVQVGVGTPVDNGDGTYDVPITAGTSTGFADLSVTVDDGRSARQLSPSTRINHVGSRIWASRSELSAATGGTIQFAYQPGFLGLNRTFILLGSNSGTRPGLFIPPFTAIPLNQDALFNVMLFGAFSGAIPELVGTTDGRGVGNTALTFPPGLYGLPLGTDLHFACVNVGPVDFASTAWRVGLRH